MADDQRPYASLYVDALLALAALPDVEAKDVFLVLLKHANNFGWCYPGDEALARLSGHRRDAMPGALNCLEALGYIHIVYTPVPHQRPVRSFQLNPTLVALRPECQAAAEKEWRHYSTPTLNEVEYFNSPTTPITFPSSDQPSITFPSSDQQPPESPPQALPVTNASESTPVTTTTNHPTQKPPEGGEAAAFDPARESAAKGQNQGGEQNQRGKRRQETPARSATSEAASPTPPTPSPSPPSLEPDDLAPYQEPLVDTYHERVAQELYLATGNMSTPTARMLVTIYGPGRTQAALRLMGAQPPESVGNRAGYVRALLRRHAISEQDRLPAQDAGLRYVTGQYADYIEH